MLSTWKNLQNHTCPLPCGSVLGQQHQSQKKDRPTTDNLDSGQSGGLEEDADRTAVLPLRTSGVWIYDINTLEKVIKGAD